MPGNWQPRQQALARMYALVQSQAAVLSYVEVYWLLAVASAVMFVASFVPPGTTSVNGNSSNNGTNTGTTTPSTIGVLSLQNLSHLNSCDTSVTLPNFTANALLNDSTTRIIQNPELRSVDGQAAKLNIGDRVPVATGSFQAGVGVGSSSAAGFVSPLVNTQFQYIDVGTNVEITPRVHPNHEVSLKISVEVSAVTNQANIGGIQQPIISQRKVIHDIRLTEGESSVLCVNQTRREQAVRAPSWAS